MKNIIKNKKYYSKLLLNSLGMNFFSMLSVLAGSKKFASLDFDKH